MLRRTCQAPRGGGTARTPGSGPRPPHHRIRPQRPAGRSRQLAQVAAGQRDSRRLAVDDAVAAGEVPAREELGVDRAPLELGLRVAGCLRALR